MIGYKVEFYRKRNERLRETEGEIVDKVQAGTTFTNNQRAAAGYSHTMYIIEDAKGKLEHIEPRHVIRIIDRNKD